MRAPEAPQGGPKRARLTTAFLAPLLAVLGPAAPVRGHPMGNVSISHYAGIEISPGEVRVKYLLDFAEIPAFRELERVDPDRDNQVTPAERKSYLEEKTREILSHLKLEVNGERLRMRAAWTHVTFPPGEGGLSTVRVAWELHGELEHDKLGKSNFLVWNDSNYEDHLGWKEIRISGLGGIGISKTSLKHNPTSSELSEYPKEYLYNPPTDTKAWCRFGEGLVGETSKGFEPPPGFGGRRRPSSFVRLLSAEELSPSVVLLSLLLALILGAGHALEPGHGKTLMAAYLVGSRGRIRHAVLLGLIVTFTHTFSVFLLGVAILFLSRFFVPERLLPWMGLGSGLLIAGVGLAMLRARWRSSGARSVHAHGSAAGRPQEPAGHSHAPAQQARLGNILALGVSGGLVPCPAGIVVLLAAVGLGRVAFGLTLIAAFSVGLGAVLVGIGVLFVTARRLLEKLPLEATLLRWLGIASALAVTGFGVTLAARSLAEAGLGIG